MTSRLHRSFLSLSERPALCWTAIVLWCALIFLLSHQPHLTSGLGTWDTVLRKIAHALEFGVLAMLLCAAFDSRVGSRGRAAVAGWTCAAIYAVSDEIHQTYIDGRVGSAIDVGIDATGALLGTLLATHWLAPRTEGTAHD